MEENKYLASMQVLAKTLPCSYALSTIQKTSTIIEQSLSEIIKDIEIFTNIINSSIKKSFSLFSMQIKHILDNIVGININTLLKIDWNFVREVNNYTKAMLDNMVNFSSIFYNTIFSQNIEQSNESEVKTETIIQDSTVVAERIANENSLTKLEKRNWLISFFRSLKKFVSSGLFAIILFIVAPIYGDIYNETIKPAYYYQEFSQMQQENLNLQLRMINRSTPLYKGKKMKSQLTILSEYEIVIVLDDSKGDRIKVQVYNTDYIGWIYKKYTIR